MCPRGRPRGQGRPRGLHLCLLVSRAKKAINVDGSVPDLVRINQYRTLATNVKLLPVRNCSITEAYELLKNMHLLDDS